MLEMFVSAEKLGWDWLMRWKYIFWFYILFALVSWCRSFLSLLPYFLWLSFWLFLFQCFIRGGEDVTARWSDHKLQRAHQSGQWKRMINISFMASDGKNLQKLCFYNSASVNWRTWSLFSWKVLECFKATNRDNRKFGCSFDTGALKLDSKHLFIKCSSFLMQVLRCECRITTGAAMRKLQYRVSI